MAVNPTRGTKRKVKKMTPKEKKMNQTVNDAALGKLKQKKKSK